MFRELISDHKPERNWRGEAGLRAAVLPRSWFSALVALFLLALVAAFGAYSIVVAPLRQEAEKFDLAELRSWSPPASSLTAMAMKWPASMC
jgi:hypothetical protein